MKSRILTILIMILYFQSVGQSVPNTTTFTLQDVVNVTGGTSLTAAFANATGTFDPAYVGSKNSLLNFRNYQVGTYRGYGLLYNWWTTISIAPTGWHVPTDAEWGSLITYLGGITTSGGRMKETGLSHWITPNTGATNDVGFNVVGSGERQLGSYIELNKSITFISSTDYNSSVFIGARFLVYNNALIDGGGSLFGKERGYSLRLIKNDSTNPGTITDADGNIYVTVKINNQVWTASNWKCTKYGNGTIIPNVTDSVTWKSLTTGAWCVYNNDPLNK